MPAPRFFSTNTRCPFAVSVATLAGVSGVVVPLAMGVLIALPFGYQGQAAVFIGLILTATSVSRYGSMRKSW